jgi:hypothetical protein
VMFNPAGSRAASNTWARTREARRTVVQAQGRGTLVDFGIGIVNSAGFEIDVYTSLAGLGCSVKGVASCGKGVGVATPIKTPGTRRIPGFRSLRFATAPVRIFGASLDIPSVIPLGWE